MKKLTSITPRLPKLVKDYLYGELQLTPFYATKPTIENLVANAGSRQFDQAKRQVLTHVLKTQAQKSKYANDVTLRQISRLGLAETVTVTTGHQLCLYGGPLFFFYKILSIISLAETMNQQRCPCVPIFWMASEDHDFEEINHLYLGHEKAEWNSAQSGAVGTMRLVNMDDFKSKIRKHLSNDIRYQDALNELDAIFSSEKTLAEATQDLVYKVFADQGVLVVDASDQELKKVFQPYITKEIETQFSQSAIEKTSKELEALGYDAQVAGREINLFWMEEGMRERIVMNDVGFNTTDGKKRWAKDQMAEAIQSAPERFSPNVILRPLYQEVILPNIAYVGGPGETSYWLQLKGVFDSAEVPMPVILLRDMFLLVNQLVKKKKNQVGLDWESFHSPVHALLTSLLRTEGSKESIVESRQDQLNKAFDSMVDEITMFDDGLGRNAQAERARLNNKLNNLKKKILRLERQKMDTTRNRIEVIQAHCFPYSTPQERIHNWLTFWPTPKSVLELLPYCNPIDSKLKVVKLD